MAVKRITKKLVERIRPPKSGRIEISDDLISGFCLRVTQKGKRTWSVVYRLNGAQKRLTFSTYPLINASAAREKAREALLLVERGIDLALQSQKAKAKKDNTFAAVVEDYIEKYAKVHNRSHKRVITANIVTFVPRF